MARRTGPAPGTYGIDEVLAELRAGGDRRLREQMGARFGIAGPTAATAYGWAVGDLRTLAKRLKRRERTPKAVGANHDLAMALWRSGQYEARLLACFVGEPTRLTVKIMDEWARGFDCWATCDTACFGLFDRAEQALVFGRVRAWARRNDEFVRRGAFALLASAALHRKEWDDGLFEACLPMIERHASDDRNFVKKGASWALRGIGKRSPGLRKSASAVAKRLAASEHAAARWVGKDALRDLVK